jgi:hypothetical protein
MNQAFAPAPSLLAAAPRPHWIRLTDGNAVAHDAWVGSGLRRVPTSGMCLVVPRKFPPSAGDVVLAQVEKIGKNARLELPSGRPRTIHVGDKMAVVFGNRYATHQIEGYARADGDACDMLSMGGLCGMVASSHTGMKEPTRLRLLGAIADRRGQPLRLQEFSLAPTLAPENPRVTAVCGTSMDSGKTHTVVSLVRGLVQAGRRVAAIKLTGTACCQDIWRIGDAGAWPVVDFVDGGLPSTYLCGVQELTELFETLHAHAASTGVQHVLVEIADGVLQRETAALLNHRPFTSRVDGWVLAAGDPLGALGAQHVLRRAGVEPIAVSGLMTCSPLAVRETEAATGLRVLTAEALVAGALNTALTSDSRKGVVA